VAAIKKMSAWHALVESGGVRSIRSRLQFSGPNPKPPTLHQVVAAMHALVQSGRVRSWGTSNWTTARIAAAVDAARFCHVIHVYTYVYIRIHM